MDRFLAVAHSYMRVLQSPVASLSTSRFWCNRLFEVGAELELPNTEIMERFETFIAVSYW